MRQFVKKLNNLHERIEWVTEKLSALPRGQLILDAGCGSQQFRRFCSHLDYRGQDFGKYHCDQKATIGSMRERDYEYGHLDYTGNIWEIDEKVGVFDAILCTEVLEHISYPGKTITEFERLIKPGGSLVLTAPFACRRHMDPYFFYSGFSDRRYEKFFD